MADPPLGPIAENSEILNPGLQNPEIAIPLQPVINLGNQILTIHLSDSNYLLWRQQVTTTVRGHDLTGYLTRTNTKPPETLNYLLNPQPLISWIVKISY